MNNKDKNVSMYSIIVAICIIMLICLFNLNSTDNSTNKEESIESTGDTVSGNIIKDRANYKFIYYHGDIPISEMYSVISTNTDNNCIVYNLKSGDILKYENNSWILLHDNIPVFQYTGQAYMEYIEND